jgi:peptidoglycan-associated lipoprotein
MKNLALAVAVSLALPFAACHKKQPQVQPPAPPETTATTPEPPPPAPVPEQPVVNTVPDDYARIKGMSLDEINRTIVPSMFPDVHFDYDRSEIKDSEKTILNTSAENLKKFDFLKVTLEGHADERGTAEYNLALSERRSRAVFDYLVSLGVDGGRLKTVGYGKEIPLCTDGTEDCHARNRRGHFAVTGK